jgi:hypothetical protein
MKLARRLQEAVVRYVPAIEFYGLNGFGWSDDIFEPNPPPNDEFFKKNALVLMEEMKDVEYATESDDNDSGSDEGAAGLVRFVQMLTRNCCTDCALILTTFCLNHRAGGHGQ